MELEDLKTAWQSVRPAIGPISLPEDADRLHDRRKGVRSRLLRRWLWSAVFTTVCLVLMATSRSWALLQLPIWWLCPVCATIFLGVIVEAAIYLRLRRINIAEDSNTKIMSAILGIKRLYRNAELVLSCLMLGLLLCISLTSPFVNTWRMYFVWILTSLAFTAEAIWYRSNIRQLNKLKDI